MEEGQRYGRLVLITRTSERSKSREILWLAQCDCGQQKLVRLSILKRGERRSCGCLKREAARTNGLKGGAYARLVSIVHKPTHSSWTSMRTRCSCPSSDDYANYGGRGIKVCTRWNDFAAFLEDMGERPDGHTIDRIDTNGDYEPSNCRWATQVQQARNRRSNRLISFEGRTLSLAEWAEIKGLTQACLLGRLKAGWSIEEAMSGKRMKERCTTARCWACKSVLPVTEFYQDSHRANGRQSRCKRCCTNQSRERISVASAT